MNQKKKMSPNIYESYSFTLDSYFKKFSPHL